MAKPIGALESHYPMIQFLINVVYFCRVLLSWDDVKRWRKNSTWLQSMVSDVYHLLTHLACVAGAWNKERARAREETRVFLSRAPVLSCVHYFQAPATLAMTHQVLGNRARFLKGR